MKCRFCQAEAVAMFNIPDGCFCCPNETEHAYCIQHIIRARPRGDMTLLEVLNAESWGFYLKWQAELYGK